MPTSRITDTFARARGESRAVLVSYLMAGDPDLETSYAAMCALRDNGADIIELGAPFTDPMADGASIQKAGLRALAHHYQVVAIVLHALAAAFWQIAEQAQGGGRSVVGHGALSAGLAGNDQPLLGPACSHH